MSVYTTRESAIHGKGLFATADIPVNQIIVEYQGERIDRQEAERREGQNEESGITYIVFVDADHFIDGAFGGNESIYMNHSCDPNCTLIRRAGQVFLTAKRPIRAGEELTFDYAFDADSPRVPCGCGSPSCRGTINDIG